MSEAYKMAQLRGISLNVGAMLVSFDAWAARKRSAWPIKVGSLQTGYAADVIVLDPRATPLLELRADVAESLDELLFALMICADDRAIAATYAAGELVL